MIVSSMATVTYTVSLMEMVLTALSMSQAHVSDKYSLQIMEGRDVYYCPYDTKMKRTYARKLHCYTSLSSVFSF